MRRIIPWCVLALLACLLAPGSAAAKSAPRAYTFFSQYCTDCSEKAPLLRDWIAKQRTHYRITGVGFMETTRDAKAFARKLRLNVPVQGDPDGTLAERLGIWSPTVIVLTRRDGKVAKVIDYAKWASSRGTARATAAAAGAAPRKARVCRAKVAGTKRLYRRVRCKGQRTKVAARCERKARGRWVKASCPKPKRPKQPAITVQPQYTPAFDVPATVASSRAVLIRYLRLNGETDYEDREFARGAAASAGAIRSVPVTCATPQTAPALLAKAEISAPVIVDTGADCRARLDAALVGAVSAPGSGPARLWLDGRPLASRLMLSTKLGEAGISDEAWMGLPESLAMSTAPNIIQTANLNPGGDTILKGFWALCPTCVSSAKEYEVQSWHAANSAVPLVAATCDSNATQVSGWIYEHGWTFPVLVYNGPLDFGACFAQIMKGQLAISWYGDVTYLSGGVPFAYDPLDRGFPELFS